MTRHARFIVALTLASGIAGAAMAETRGCSQCGGGVRRVCRPVTTTRPVEIDVWDAKEEDMAVPLASLLLRCNCGGWGGSCCATGECKLCLTGGCRACCKVRPRNRLMRKTVLQEVPVVVWVVEYVCADCAARGGAVHCTTPVPEPHFFDASATPPPPMPELTAVYASDLAQTPPANPQNRSVLDELIQTLQGSMQRK